MTNETNNKEYSLEQILRATLYSIGDAVVATDKRGRVTLMNPVAEKSRRDERLVKKMYKCIQVPEGRPCNN
jgi:signal transduction histidine kinase